MAAKAKKTTQSRADSHAAAREPATEKDVRVRVFAGHDGLVLSVAMPADGRFALTSGFQDATVRWWELEADYTQSESILKATRVFGLAVTADGRDAAMGDSAGTIHLIDLASGRKLRKWKGHETRVDDLAFGKEGREVLSVGGDSYLRRSAGCPSRVRDFMLSPRRRMAVESSAGLQTKGWPCGPVAMTRSLSL
jgi:WD40 repeat protein